MGWQIVGLGIVAAVTLAGGAETVCRACESGLCIDPSLYSTVEGQAGHSAAYAISFCDGNACELECSYNHLSPDSEEPTARCNPMTGRYTLAGCRPDMALRGASKLQQLAGKNATLYLFHNRKAGGTSLEHWLSKVAKALGFGFERVEGQSINLELVKKCNQNGVTFTSLREPVERVLSGYKFEGRWKLRTLHYAWMDHNQLVTNDKIDRTEHEYVDAAEKSSALTRAISCQIDPEYCCFRSWSCVTMCYTKMFSNYACLSDAGFSSAARVDRVQHRHHTNTTAVDILHPTETVTNATWAPMLAKAAATIDAIDFVYVVEEMREKEYVARMESALLALLKDDVRQKCSFVYKNPVTGSIPRPNFTIADDVMGHLKENNRLDRLLWQRYARRSYF